ncbi:MAG: hypothetical protein RBT16_15350 [Desulfococcus multivorans]|nr:hypothetical protein [Desulfococcus multivorans]
MIRKLLLLTLLFGWASMAHASGYTETVKIWKTLEERGKWYEESLTEAYRGYHENPEISDPMKMFCQEQKEKQSLTQCDKNGVSFLVNDTTRLIFSDKQTLVGAKIVKEGIIATYTIGSDGENHYEATDGESKISFILHQELRKKTVFEKITGKDLDYLGTPKALEWLTNLYFLDFEPSGTRLDAFAKRLLLDWTFRDEIRDKWDKWDKNTTVPREAYEGGVMKASDIPIPSLPGVFPGGTGAAPVYGTDGKTDEQFLVDEIKKFWKEKRIYVAGLREDQVTLLALYAQNGELIRAEIEGRTSRDPFSQNLLFIMNRDLRKVERELAQSEFRMTFKLGDLQEFEE